ncbi:MAG: cytochrome c oxidase subunit 4 [Chloroflexi bacterium]|nr:cytochrome c oxidase subunit 4 [Chloroflexota bacterium]MBV9899342.1 cytochrome c oxidase subunit 4 [Chloroflexota bacterium]
MSEHEHVHLPSPSVWPVTLAGGVTLVGFGLLTSVALSILGLVLMAWGLFGWIMELRHGG